MKFRILVFLLLLVALLYPGTALAINYPDNPFSISAVDVYQNLLETGDQLYIVEYYITYTANPTENVNTAYIGRLMNGATQIAAVSPYSYYNKGYGRWIFSIYANASTAPTWTTTACTIRLEGNPTLSWSPTVPLTTWPIVASNWHTTSTPDQSKRALESRLTAIATNLETTWNIDFIQSTTGLFSYLILTSYGVDYFTNAIGNLYQIAPYIMPSNIIIPPVQEKSYTKSLPTELENKLAGTAIDRFFNSRPMGLSPALGKFLVFFILIGVVGVAISVKIGNPKPALFLAIPFGIALTCLSFGSLIFWAILGLFAIIGMGFVFFLRRAG